MEIENVKSSRFLINSVFMSFFMCLTPVECVELKIIAVIKLKSLILAQIERWRHALHMQVER